MHTSHVPSSLSSSSSTKYNSENVSWFNGRSIIIKKVLTGKHKMQLVHVHISLLHKITECALKPVLP